MTQRKRTQTAQQGVDAAALTALITVIIDRTIERTVERTIETMLREAPKTTARRKRAEKAR